MRATFDCKRRGRQEAIKQRAQMGHRTPSSEELLRDIRSSEWYTRKTEFSNTKMMEGIPRACRDNPPRYL